jgi:hypothetical protein
MSYNTIPIDLDKEQLRNFLEKLSKRTLRRDEAARLKPLLERILRDVITQRDTILASEMTQMLIALDGYIHERIDLENVPNYL